MTGLYILENDQAVPCLDAKQWAQWFEEADRIITRTNIDINQGPAIEVSTMFVGVDPEHLGHLYETIIFGGKCDAKKTWYATREKALVGHKAIVAWVLAQERRDRKDGAPNRGNC